MIFYFCNFILLILYSYKIILLLEYILLLLIFYSPINDFQFLFYCSFLIKGKLRANIFPIKLVMIGSQVCNKGLFTFEGVPVRQDSDGTFGRELLIPDGVNFGAPRIATHPHEMARAIGPYCCLEQLPATR